ncbi:MAG: GGDEF domain-containing protein [Planctomycetes bacterium]|nr:GGDEF domain-containing protein [Planctomycetota bacterium]
MSTRVHSSRSQEDTDADRLRGLFTPDALSLDVVSAIAGDRPLTEAEKDFLDEQKTRRAEQFFSDILYVVAHQHFPPEVAEKLWNEVLRHKYEMSEALNRNVRIVVAALDYLSNFRRELVSTTLIGEAHIAAIANLSMRDGLTGLFNHTSCFELIEVELKLHERYRTAVSLLMMDIDNFKKVNDLHGHQEGDKILAELSAILKRETRVSDICCRYGGDEFAVIMPLTDAPEAGEIAERLRTALMRSLPGGGKLTVSLGVAFCDEKTKSSLAFMKKADNALYQAKKNGKNRVVVIAPGASMSDKAG